MPWNLKNWQINNLWANLRDPQEPLWALRPPLRNLGCPWLTNIIIRCVSISFHRAARFYWTYPKISAKQSKANRFELLWDSNQGWAICFELLRQWFCFELFASSCFEFYFYNYASIWFGSNCWIYLMIWKYLKRSE